MFDHCIQAMSAAESDVVMDLMQQDPPSANAYDELKATFTERRSTSTSERVQRLRALGLLADQRSPDLLLLIEGILGLSIEGGVIATEGFLMRLQSQIQLIVPAQAGIFTVEQLAKMADRLASVPTIQGASANVNVVQEEGLFHSEDPLKLKRCMRRWPS